MDTDGMDAYKTKLALTFGSQSGLATERIVSSQRIHLHLLPKLNAYVEFGTEV